MPKPVDLRSPKAESVQVAQARRRNGIAIARKLKDRAEPPPNPNGGYVEEIVSHGKIAQGTRYRAARVTQLERYFAAGKIGPAEFEAGQAYARDYEILFRSGRDSLDFEIGGGGQGRTPLSQAQADALSRLIAIDAGLSQADRAIVKAVCVMDRPALDAMKDIIGEPRFAFAVPRLKEALRNLVRASDEARARKFRAPQRR